MKLNREQIITALERSIRVSMALNYDCPRITYSELKDALSLIKELTEENESLRAEGEWIEKNPEDALYRYTCSLCGKTRLGKKTPYCANCGAKMKGE